jgi:hypothetical protein
MARAARESKESQPVTEDVQRDPRVQSIRPGEVIVRCMLEQDEPTLASYYQPPGSLSLFSHVFKGGHTYLLRESELADPHGDVAALIDRGTLEIVEGVTEAELPATIDASDNVARAIALRGFWEPDEQQAKQMFRQRYAEYSLGDAIWQVVHQTDLPEEVVADELCRIYEESFVLQRASETPWVRRGEELIELWKARRQVEQEEGEFIAGM